MSSQHGFADHLLDFLRGPLELGFFFFFYFFGGVFKSNLVYVSSLEWMH